MDSLRIDEIARRLIERVPPALRSMQADLESNFRAVLRERLSKLDLVNRDEFDAQARVLERTRARLEALEARLAALKAKPPRTKGRRPRLLVHLHHVVDGLFDQIVGQVRAAALGRHDAALALETLEGMPVQRRFALGDTRRPDGLVADLGCAGDAGAVAGAAHLLEHLSAVLGRRGRARRTARRRGLALDRQRGIVLAGNGHLARRLQTRGHFLVVVGFLHHLLVLRVAGDDACEREDANRDQDQQPEHQAEDIDEVGVLFAHVEPGSADGQFGGEV